jgi:hypothetical protein
MSGGNLLVVVIVQLGLTAMPGVAAALFAVRFGVRKEPVLLAIALAGSGAAAMVTFWTYYAVAGLGGFCAYLVFFGSIALAIWSWPGLSQNRALLKRLAVPLALWALASLFIVFFGFLHGGAEKAVETASFRFSTQPSPFATDSSIPLFFSEWMFAGHPAPTPIFEPGWLFSDRPPLQVAYVLTQHIFGWDTTTLHYEVLGVILQQFWVVGMWALLTAARVPNRTRALVMAATLVCDVTVVNSFYVWPKLLAAAFVLAALALLVPQRRGAMKTAPWTFVLLCALAGLAYLSHGTSVFGLIPVAVVALWSGLPNWRWLAGGAAAVVLLVVPWTAYQHYGDPPGNRLAKWALAGSAAIDNRGVLETIGDEYAKEGVGGSLNNKWENFLTMAGGNPAIGKPTDGQVPFGDVITEIRDTVSDAGNGEWAVVASKIREIRHWHLLWTLGILLLGLPIILLARLRGRWRADEDWRFAKFSLIVFGIGTVAWGLLMFGSIAGRTVVTQDCLALPLLGMAAVVAALRATYPRLTLWLVGANVVTVLILYTPYLPPHPGYSYSGFAAVAAAASLAGFLMVAFSVGPHRSQGRWRLHAETAPATLGDSAPVDG